MGPVTECTTEHFTEEREMMEDTSLSNLRMF